ncbi:MAG: C45 family autoproteolytic acyltransferase/hydrolase [Acidimicrobiales bacterium]|nr:C45 family autoproteolytic acyltransferase/hydrolase [Acidimicrobiales bacterium]MDP6697054.1 C45 family autoproteolytic acyltransferase/hydrolase [Acidimicrobiales bacterium]
MKRPPMRILDLSGSPGSMGHIHGEAHADEIRSYAEERVRLAGTSFWAGGELDRGAVLEIARECLPAHEAHSPDLYEEMCALADGAGITREEAVVVGGFTDFVDTVRSEVGGTHPDQVIEDDCTAAIVPDSLADGSGFLAQTWDMHDSATEHVVLLRVRPTDGPAALVFTTTGCLGQIGMNEAGVCVGINNLVAADGCHGVMWPSVVRDLLLRSSADEALEALLEADLAGGHSFLIMDTDGVGHVVEAMPTARPFESLGDHALVHTNHTVHPDASAVEGPKPQGLVANSIRRLARATELLDRNGITSDDLMALTRDPEAICQVSTDPFHIESSGGAVMRPRTLDFWAVWGIPSQNEYVHVPFGG